MAKLPAVPQKPPKPTAKLPPVSTRDSSPPPEKPKALAPPGDTLQEASARARDRLQRPTRKTESGYGADDQPAKLSPATSPSEFELRPTRPDTREPQLQSLTNIWQNRMIAMICAHTAKRCAVYTELESLRDNFRGDTLPGYRAIVEFHVQLYTQLCEAERALVTAAKKVFPNLELPRTVINYPHIQLLLPKGLDEAIQAIDGKKYVDGRKAGAA